MTLLRLALLPALLVLVGPVLAPGAAEAAGAHHLILFGPRLSHGGVGDGDGDGQEGVTVHDRADAERLLTGTPRSLRKYVAKEGRAIQKGDAACSPANADDGAAVLAYSPRRHGFGVGAGGICGGTWGDALVIVGRIHGHWKLIEGTQEWWDCGPLRKHHVPGAVVRAFPMGPDATHDCFDYRTGQPGNV